MKENKQNWLADPEPEGQIIHPKENGWMALDFTLLSTALLLIQEKKGRAELSYEVN